VPSTEPLLRTRLSLKSFAGLYAVLGVICVAIWWVGAAYDTGISIAVIVLLGPALLAIGVGYTWLVRLGTEYRLYAESLEVESGLVGRRIENLQLFRVRDLALRQSVLGRLFGVGDITVTSTDQSTPHLTVRGVEHPRDLYDRLREGAARSQATRRTMIVEQEPPSS
jgi:uncharacterized membrane protein YdbT with pleckstrin-like domain